MRHGNGQIFACGDRSLWLLDAPPAPVADAVATASAGPAPAQWSWTAADSPQIDPAHHKWFYAIDECKPVANGRLVLICSSWLGSVALIRRRDKACLFYALGENAHSADLVGADLLAVAFSDRTDELRLYRLDAAAVAPDGDARMAAGAALAESPAFSMPLVGAHGAVWDERRGVLWAMGYDELLKLRIHRAPALSADVLGRWPLPGGRGHDLYPWDENRLSLTVREGAYLFDVNDGTMTPMAEFQGQRFLKSVARDAGTGRVMFTQGEPVFTSNVRFLDGASVPLGELNGYKARWDAPHSFARFALGVASGVAGEQEIRRSTTSAAERAGRTVR